MYAEIDFRTCRSYGYYQVLHEAIFACSGDENCEKVLTDQDHPFFGLCSWNSTEHLKKPNEYYKSIIYKKLGKYGSRYQIKFLL